MSFTPESMTGRDTLRRRRPTKEDLSTDPFPPAVEDALAGQFDRMMDWRSGVTFWKCRQSNALAALPMEMMYDLDNMAENQSIHLMRVQSMQSNKPSCVESKENSAKSNDTESNHKSSLRMKPYHKSSLRIKSNLKSSLHIKSNHKSSSCMKSNCMQSSSCTNSNDNFPSTKPDNTKSSSDEDSNEMMAAKVFYFERGSPLAIRETIRSYDMEWSVMQHVKHEHVINCFSPLVSKEVGIILTDYTPETTLLDHLKYLTDSDITRYFLQISRALRYIHHRGWVHRDLRPENVMIRKGNAIVMGFGKAIDPIKVMNLGWIKGAVGAPGYIAPELISATSETWYDGIKADSFALGVILWCMLMKRVPTPQTKFSPFVFPRKMDSTLTFCMRRLLRTDPVSRYDVTALLEELIGRGYHVDLINKL